MKTNPESIAIQRENVSSSFQIQRTDFAPNSIWSFKIPNHEQLNKALTEMIEDERALTPESRNCAGREMWQSQRPVDKDPPVVKLFESIYKAAYEVAEFLKWDINGLQPRVQVCWANAHPPGSYHTRHIHPADVHLSGVYYIRTAPSCGDIIFHDLPRFLGLWGKVPRPMENNSHNAFQHTISPEDGLCILFPAYQMHEVATNKSEIDRLGIAFNINFE